MEPNACYMVPSHHIPPTPARVRVTSLVFSLVSVLFILHFDRKQFSLDSLLMLFLKYHAIFIFLFYIPLPTCFHPCTIRELENINLQGSSQANVLSLWNVPLVG